MYETNEMSMIRWQGGFTLKGRKCTAPTTAGIVTRAVELMR